MSGMQVLKKELENPHDPLAIAIFDKRGRVLRYAPKAKNEVPACLMDSGRFIFGKLASKE